MEDDMTDKKVLLDCHPPPAEAFARQAADQPTKIHQAVRLASANCAASGPLTARRVGPADLPTMMTISEPATTDPDLGRPASQDPPTTPTVGIPANHRPAHRRVSPVVDRRLGWQ
jgi:hypothetical protein